jgi:hypothetical protein
MAGGWIMAFSDTVLHLLMLCMVRKSELTEARLAFH